MPTLRPLLIVGVPLFLVAQVPAFYSWIELTTPWQQSLAQTPVQYAILSSAVLVAVGVLAFAAVAAIVLWVARLVFGRGMARWARFSSVTVASLAGAGAAAALEWNMVALMK